MPERRRTPRRFRRSEHLVSFWTGGALHITNYATGVTVRANPLACAALDLCGAWTDAASLAGALGLTNARALRLLTRLAGATLVRRQGTPVDPREVAMRRFAPWNPAAGFFHSATRDVRFVPESRSARRAGGAAAPPAVTRYRGAPLVDLPRVKGGETRDVLTRRRTWRRFSTRPVALGELSTLLGLSLGVQQWARAGDREVALKTSPSGGARHPIEGYVVARRVTGLRAGLYHYAADRHALERLGPAPSDARLRQYVPRSTWFARAPVLLLLTAVFTRQLWRYPYARAYRAALIEAGHVAQTWCVTATALELAPFCLMGLADSVIEHDLRLDGVSESVLYAAGCGHKPAHQSWAPLARGTLTARRNPKM